MINRSSKYGNAPRRGGNMFGGFKWFFYGVLLGAVGIFIAMRWGTPPAPIQLVIQTPAPTDNQEVAHEEYTWSEGGTIGVAGIKPNTKLISPYTIRGLAQVPGDKLHLRIIGVIKAKKKGEVDKEELVAEADLQAKPYDPGFHGPFEGTVEIKTAAKEGRLELEATVTKDNTTPEKLVVPVVF